MLIDSVSAGLPSPEGKIVGRLIPVRHSFRVRVQIRLWMIKMRRCPTTAAWNAALRPCGILAVVALLCGPLCNAAVAEPPAVSADPQAGTGAPGAAEERSGLAVPPGESPGEKDRSRTILEASWENGLWFRAADAFRIHVGGNAQVDSTWLIGPKGLFAIPGGGMNGVENASATFLRRARLRFEGDIYDQVDYIVEYDFAHAVNDGGTAPPSFGNLTGTPAPANVWMQVREVPYLGNVRFGYQVKPIGMTNNTYQGFLPFLERADNQDAFYGPFDSGFALGLSARNWSEDERMTWQFGAYRPLTNVFGVGLNKLVYGGRVTALPWYEDDGARLVHVGFGTLNGEVVQDQLRVRARPELRNGPGFAVPVLVDTGELPGHRQYTVAPEFAMVLGPWTAQAEWTGQFFTHALDKNGQLQGTVIYQGGYVEVLYFLTGEHQEYDRREGVFGRVIPRSNFRWKKDDPEYGLGAWQIGARFSYLDLNNKAIQGGQVYDWTVGLNWFLNPNMKFQLNYILEHRDAPQGIVQGWISGVGLRGAYDF
jgi:phosphate-selective porin OprO/OprP